MSTEPTDFTTDHPCGGGRDYLVTIVDLASGPSGYRPLLVPLRPMPRATSGSQFSGSSQRAALGMFRTALACRALTLCKRRDAPTKISAVTRTADVSIRRPLWVRRFIAVFGAVTLAVGVAVIVAAITQGAPPAFFVVALVLLSCVFLLHYRNLRLAVVSVGDTLVARNLFSTLRVAGDDVVGIRVGWFMNQPRGSRVVQLVLRDETVVVLHATINGARTAARRARLEADLQQLTQWVRDTTEE